MEADQAASRIGTTTADFCAGVRDCTAHLPVALAAYRDGDTEAFHESAAEAAAAESACDDYARDLRTALATLDPDLTGVYLRARDLLDLLSRLDDVANAVEDALAALASMAPDLDASGDALIDLGTLAARATERLCDAVAEYVAALCADESPTIERETIDAIRDVEHRCDDLKQDALAAAFAPGLSVNGLAVREVTLALDGVANTVEDAADQLAVVASATP
ncbi:DUF47 family protein [Halarchaeum sp. CBA1220]|uniref:DUF47 family protein n=1 Tax=Halarchaeum sp. CBA1220 TaxID=1853682 RepID=UPI000F3A943B|nr:DUF47 family protein [Halarchaeum sp. CBA1220]QLC34530.1 DUF47 family protein [Halarchaeum sp. CBA1220]